MIELVEPRFMVTMTLRLNFKVVMLWCSRQKNWGNFLSLVALFVVDILCCSSMSNSNADVNTKMLIYLNVIKKGFPEIGE